MKVQLFGWFWELCVRGSRLVGQRVARCTIDMANTAHGTAHAGTAMQRTCICAASIHWSASTHCPSPPPPHPIVGGGVRAPAAPFPSLPWQFVLFRDAYSSFGPNLNASRALRPALLFSYKSNTRRFVPRSLTLGSSLKYNLVHFPIKVPFTLTFFVPSPFLSPSYKYNPFPCTRVLPRRNVSYYCTIYKSLFYFSNCCLLYRGWHTKELSGKFIRLTGTIWFGWKELRFVILHPEE